MVAELLHELGYHFQANRKVREDRDYADWDALLGYVNRTAHAYFAAGDPVISVEARKNEFVGEFRNGGRNRSPQGTLENEWVSDVLLSELGRVLPYEGYHLGHNDDSITIDVNHDIVPSR
jgi:hypothetical protein